MQRRLFTRPLNAVFSTSVSALALNILDPVLRSLAHTGMRPHLDSSKRRPSSWTLMIRST